MLLELNIKNFILIENHTINFKKGFSTLTGETGAGKSIILDAINLLKGQRAESKFLKDPEQKAIIEANFSIDSLSEIKNILEENDLLDEENPDFLILKRVILPNGKSNSYINNFKSSLSLLKSISNQLIEIHSQHSNRNITNNEEQLNMLDIFSNLKEEVFDLNNLSKSIKNIEKEIKKIEEEKEENKNKIELIQYKLEELIELNLQENEYEELSNEYKKLANAETINSDCDNNISNINNINSLIFKVNNNLESFDIFEGNEQVKKMVDEIIINLEEVDNYFKDVQSNVFVDNLRLLEVEERLNKINSLSKKHFVEPENFGVFISELKSDMDTFNSFDEDILKLTNEKNILEEKWVEKANTLSNKRKESAKLLEKIITKKINTLKMKNAIFKINFKNKKENFNKNGFDNISFDIATNLGSNFEELKKAASGGELSRIALSMQSTISKNYNIPVQIFDEIDSGIGGTTGNTIGSFLKEISSNSQVISITHLAQVAVFAEHNYYIHKNEENNKTTTHIKYLGEEEKYKEFSRMMGYEEFNDKNKKIVKELINSSLNTSA